MSNAGVIAVESSGNHKLGDVSATYVGQQTCPSSCPLRHAGCYAEVGRMGIHTHRLNARVRGLKRSLTAVRLQLARAEAAAIRALSGLNKLRAHVVGDCPTASSARLVGAAMVAHERKHGRLAWTYTHAWATVRASSWCGARVLASCESVADIAKARAMGYLGIALIVPKHPSNKVYDYQGVKVLPCPAQFEGKSGGRVVTCADCSICQQPLMLATRGLVVGFQPDRGTSAGKLLQVN